MEQPECKHSYILSGRFCLYCQVLVSRIRNGLVGDKGHERGHPRRSIRGLPFSFISVNGEQKSAVGVCLLQGHHYSIDRHTDRDKEGDGHDDREIIQRHSKGDWGCVGQRTRQRIKGLNMKKRDGRSLCSGDRQGKVVLSWDQRGISLCILCALSVMFFTAGSR